MPTRRLTRHVASATALLGIVAIWLAPALCAAEPQRSERPTYFDGKLLSAAELEREQDYYRRDPNASAPFGRISGLSVSLDGGSLTIAAGRAITPSGEDVILKNPMRIEKPVADGKYYVLVCAVLREQGKRCQALAVVENHGGRIRIGAADPR